MGRYYTGDIEGKFMFGVQNSDAADRYGQCGSNNYLDYCYHTEHLPELIAELKTILTNSKVRKVRQFMNRCKGYHEDQLISAGLGKQDLSDYADYMLGIQILKCVRQKGECVFQAEL